MNDENKTPVFVGTSVLVTGGSGFIGNHLSRALLARGASVNVLSRHPETAPTGAARLTCDLRDRDSVRSAFASIRPQVVVHLASLPDAGESYDHIRGSIESNTLGTLNLLDAALESGNVDLLVYGDSTKSYGNCDGPYHAGLPDQPLSSYSISKVAGWHLCTMYHRLHGLPVVSLRPTLVYGPQQPRNLIDFVIGSVLAGRSEITLQGGRQTRDPLFIDDAVNAYLAAIANGTRLGEAVIAVGGGAEYSVAAIARRIVELMAGETRVHSDEGQARATDTLRSRCDNRQAEELLGWHPGYDLDSGLASTIAWYRKRISG